MCVVGEMTIKYLVCGHTYTADADWPCLASPICDNRRMETVWEEINVPCMKCRDDWVPKTNDAGGFTWVRSCGVRSEAKEAQ